MRMHCGGHLEFIAETRFRVLDPEGVRRLQKVLPLILKAVDDQGDVEQVLKRLLSIVSAVLKRSAYLVLSVKTRLPYAPR